MKKIKKIGIMSLALTIFFSVFIGFKQLDATELETENSEVNAVQPRSTDPAAFTFLPAANMITGYNVALGGTDVVIPSEIGGVKVLTIGNNAFEKKGITSLVLPEGITKIGRSAFSNSSSGGTQNSLQGLVLPSSLITIDASAFYNCKGVGDLVIPDSVVTIGHSSFTGAEVTSLTLGNNVTTIDANAFKGNKISGKVSIPESVTTIGVSAFESNSTLTEINIPSQVTTIANNAFKLCDIKKLVIPSTVTQIGSNSFESNSNLESVEFSEGLVSMGASAFAGCRLQKLVLPDSLTTLGTSAFSNNRVLNEIHLGPNITNIPESCFASNALQSFEIPATVQSIEAYAFTGNQMLEIDLPDTVTTLDSKAFGLQRIKVPVTKMTTQNIGGNDYSWYCDLSRLANVDVSRIVGPDASWGVFDPVTSVVTTTKTAKDFTILKYYYKLKNSTIESDTAFQVYLDLNGAQEFDVYFKDADGTLLETQHVPFAQSAKEPTVRPNPPVGKKFLKWDKSFNSIMDVLEVTAIYETEKLDVTFTEVDDSVVYSTDTVDYGELVSKPIDDPIKNGYTFGGWFTDKGCTTQWDFLNNTVTSDIRLYAKWTINNYTITYNNLQGSATSNPTSYNVDTETITLTSPTNRDHYTFDGWYDGLGNKVSEIAKGSTGNIVLVARWKTVEYDITYLDTRGCANPNPTKIDTESEHILEDLDAIEGYTFDGWEDENGVKITKIAIGTTGPITIKARWKLTDYTITYTNLFTSTTNNPTTYTIETETIVLTSPTNRDHYTFDGWYDGNGNKVVKIDKNSVGDIILEAKWKAIDYAITYLDTKGASNPNPSKIDTESEHTLQDLDDVVGYTFDGWEDENGATITKINKGTTAPITIRAKWKLVDYTITYHMPSGITTTLPTTYTIESGPIVLDTLDAMVGYTFENWKNDKGQVMTMIPTGSHGNLDLYAQYKANQYRVTLVDGIKDETITVTYEKEFGTLPTPQKEHYLFMGWYTQENGQGDLINANSKVSNAYDFNLYAYWQKVFFEDTQGNVKFEDGQDEKLVLKIEQKDIAVEKRIEHLKSTYDIYFTLNDQRINVDDKKMTITLHLKAEEKGFTHYKIVYMDEDGNVKEEFIPLIVQNGDALQFETTHLSIYGIVAWNDAVGDGSETKPIPPVSDTNPDSPKTGDSSNGLFWSIMTIFSSFTIVMAMQMQKRKRRIGKCEQD